MVRHVDTRQRLDEILLLIIETYIEEPEPVSSKQLCEKYRLPCSSATVRHVMELLEEEGFLIHVHTSSGRVPTQKGFRYYVDTLMKHHQYAGLDLADEIENVFRKIGTIDGLLSKTSEMLATMTHYTGVALLDDRLFMKGAHFMLDYPEMLQNLESLKSIFMLFEEQLNEMKHVLTGCLTFEYKVFIGQELGFKNIPDCAAIVSGFQINDEHQGALALLGPVRMNYTRSIDELSLMRDKLKTKLAEIV